MDMQLARIEGRIGNVDEKPGQAKNSTVLKKNYIEARRMVAKLRGTKLLKKVA